MKPGPARSLPREALRRPQVRLLGEVGEAMVRALRERLAELPDADPLVIELFTLGGDAEAGRLLAQEVRELRRAGRRVLFLGKTCVYSAGVTMMAAFPVADRYLTADTMLLVHCRRMDEQVLFQGPLRSCARAARMQLSKIQAGIRLQDEGYAELIEGSDVTFEEVCRRAEDNWYLKADDALERRLIAAVV